MKQSLLLLSLGFFSALQLASAGDITGTITLKGTPPAEVDIGPTMTANNPDCAALYAAGALPTTHFYAVGAKGELADVVVTLEVWPDMIHAFPLFHQQLAAGRRAIVRAGKFIWEMQAGNLA